MKLGKHTATGRPHGSRELETAPSTPRRLSILVVDDDPDSAEGIGLLLEQWKHFVRVAYEGRQALEIFREQRPDLVLVDIGLPGMDGYEVAVRLRGESHQAFLVALTATTDRRRAIAAGFGEHFPKPVDLDALRGLLSKMARGVRGARVAWP